MTHSLKITAAMLAILPLFAANAHAQVVNTNTVDLDKLYDPALQKDITQNGEYNSVVSNYFNGKGTSLTITQVGTSNQFRLNPNIAANDVRLAYPTKESSINSRTVGNKNTVDVNLVGSGSAVPSGSHTISTDISSDFKVTSNNNTIRADVNGGQSNTLTQRVKGSGNNLLDSTVGSNNSYVTRVNGSNNKVRNTTHRTIRPVKNVYYDRNTVDSRTFGDNNTIETVYMGSDNNLRSWAGNPYNTSSNNNSLSNQVYGNSNDSYIQALGSDNTLNAQIGSGDSRFVDGGNSLRLANDNTLMLTARGNSNKLSTFQYGTGNKADVSFTGDGNVGNRFSQDGAYNSMNVNFKGSSNNNNQITQTGNGKSLNFSYRGTNVHGGNPGQGIVLNQ